MQLRSHSAIVPFLSAAGTQDDVLPLHDWPLHSSLRDREGGDCDEFVKSGAALPSVADRRVAYASFTLALVNRAEVPGRFYWLFDISETTL